MQPCKVEGCQRSGRLKRGMCDIHYDRWRRFGDPSPRTASNGAGAEFISNAIKYRGTDCYLWPYGKAGGYGSIQLNGRTKRAHRIVCEAVYGPPPFPKAEAAHTCGVRACCNPGHLRWDTRIGNSADTLVHGTRLLGEQVAGAKLTAADITAIRAQPDRSPSALAEEYGVRPALIRRIRIREIWRHI